MHTVKDQLLNPMHIQNSWLEIAVQFLEFFVGLDIFLKSVFPSGFAMRL